jgi:DNA-binding XRE family transcriptional regulator
VKRKDISPVWTRSSPVTKDAQTIGQHLRKKRFSLGLRQSEAAQQLRVSERTLSLWETDRVYPTWPQQPAVIAYLGYNPFTSAALGRPRGNESSEIAILSLGIPKNIGQQILKSRLEMKKARNQLAQELEVSVKTLRAWEMNQRQPLRSHRKRIDVFLGTVPQTE